MTAASPRFDLVILNHTSCKSIESLVQELLVILDKTGDPYLEYKLSEALLFEQNSSAILDDIDQETGEAYQEKFRELDVETELRPTLNLVAMESPEKEGPEEQYTCPACEHTQPKQGGIGATDTCNRCGIVGDKLQKNQRRQEVYELEKRKLEQAQNKQVNEAVERAHYDEQETLRDEAREKLGIKKKSKPYLTAIAGLGLVAAVGTAAYFIAGRTVEETTGKDGTQTANAKDNGTAINNTPNGQQKPLVTIQGGSGSIVVNNALPTQAGAEQTAAGKGGSKGTTGSTIAATDSTGGTAGDSGINSSTDELTAEVALNAATKSMQNTAASDGQKIAQATAQNGQQNNTQQNQAEVKLAALAPNTQAQQNLDSQAIANTGVTPAKSTTDVFTHKKPKMMPNAVSAPREIDTLKQLLRGSPEHSEHFFNQLGQKQFNEHRQRLQRLLKLDKPDLALIFAEGIEDPYLASLMVLEIARHEKKARRTELDDAILLSMKALAAKGGASVSSSAMLSATMSQAYDFTGDKESARTLLEQSVNTLNRTDITVEQTCRLLGQIDRNHREFGNQRGADFMAETLINFASKLPETDHIYRSRIYTHLAATALRENKQEDAAEWLKHIPVQNAQEELLSQMKIIVADARKAAKKK